MLEAVGGHARSCIVG